MKFIGIAALLLVAACAKSPSSIAPVAVPSAEYDHLSCAQLSAKLAKTVALLEEASDKQNVAQAADAAGVFFILIPPSALLGDSEADVAKYKGERDAISRSIDKRCG